MSKHLVAASIYVFIVCIGAVFLLLEYVEQVDAFLGE